MNLERLETVGDSLSKMRRKNHYIKQICVKMCMLFIAVSYLLFLKYASTVHLYHKHVSEHEGNLSFLRSKMVGFCSLAGNALLAAILMAGVKLRAVQAGQGAEAAGAAAGEQVRADRQLAAARLLLSRQRAALLPHQDAGRSPSFPFYISYQRQ